jgi:hypothetical protein
MSWWSQTPVRDASAADPLITVDGILYVGNSSADPAAEARGAYLSQLVDEQFASRDGNGVLIPWDGLHRLVGDKAHSSSVRLLNLPPFTHLVPQIESSGVPSDPSFQIFIRGWASREAVRPEVGVERQGACLVVKGSRQLIPAQIYSLIQEMRELADRGSAWTSEERLLCAGRVRALALECGARLDHYLANTNIVAADQLDLELHRSDFIGAPVIEIRPIPKGVPKEWIDAFDRYDSARRRYDLSQRDGGTTHLVTTPQVTEALQAIKRIPGRRVASDEARVFVHNPYAVLGDTAEQVINEAQFEASRHASGLTGKVLRAAENSTPDQATLPATLIDVGATSPDIDISVGRAEGHAICEAHHRSASRGLPLFAWQGHEIAVGGETETSLARIRQWLVGSELIHFSIGRAEVLDLTAYSDRVVGFDGVAISVPYVARKDAGKGWIPENVEHGVVRKETPSGPSENLRFTPDQIKELAANVERAEKSGASEIRVPGMDRAVSVKEATAWVKAFESEDIPMRKSPREPGPEKDPEGVGPTPILTILHNIEKLEYDRSESSARSLLPSVPSGQEPQLPAALRPTISLLPHQRSGLGWLQHRFKLDDKGVTGCLLADDMGLGKTLQALCLISWYLENHKNAQPCLIIAPVSLLENWKSEIDKFLDGRHSPVLSLYGAELRAERAAVEEIDPELQELGLRKFLRQGFERDYRIVLTTYETLRDYEFSIARVQWGIVVCDEAQKIKTPSALVTRAAKALRAHFKVACTGTPVENTLADLWCLFDFFQPGLLGSLNEFTNKFRRKIETRADAHEELVETLRAMVSPWILRRMKFEVTKLPKRIDHQHADADFEWRLPMSDLQRRLYAAAVQQYRQITKTEAQGTAILRVLHTLRMICSNPLACVHDDADTLPISDHLRDSPKLAWLLERLSEIRTRGEKAIVFTEYRELQRLIQRAVIHRFDFRPEIVNGSTSVDSRSEASRQILIDRFQAPEGFGAIILSTTAVGFGVNVQGANHVIHFTRPWNPAKEDQATDRAYRIGQMRDVFVYCPTVVGSNFESFDQRVDALLADKRSLSKDILAGTQEITLDEFKGL